MKRTTIFTLIAFLLISNIFSQENLNNYKYLIVPKKFEFLKEADQYQLNSLTKFLFEKENFTVFFDDNLPDGLRKNRCLALFSNVFEGSGMFKTKLSIELKDCNNEVVFKTQEGVSRVKEYKKAYHEALRDAFKSFNTIDYKYEPEQVEEEIVEVKPVEIKKVEKPEIKEIPKEKIVIKPKIVESKKTEIDVEKPKSEVVLNQPDAIETTKKEVKEESKQEINGMPKEVEQVRKEIMLQKPIVDIVDKELIAKKFDLGFNVFDSMSNEVMVLYMTGSEDVYMVKDKNAVVSKNRNGFWVYSENDGTNFLVKSIKIKFQ